MQPADVVIGKSLDSHFDDKVMRQRMLSLLEGRESQSVRVDFSGCIHANSVGLRRWLRAKVGVKLTYVGVPLWLLDQFSVQPDLVVGSHVESILVPLRNKKTDELGDFTLVLGKDLPLQESYSDFEVKLGSGADAKVYAPHFDVESSLAFMKWLRRSAG